MKIFKKDFNSHIRDAYEVEAFTKTTSEITKFFSSIERVENYSLPEEERKKGAQRPHLTPTNVTEKREWTYHSPKFSRFEFNYLVKHEELYNRYLEQVLALKPAQIIPAKKLSQNEIDDLYIKAINYLEEDWNFHRAFYKVFWDVSGETVLFLDLQAFCSTRHVRFTMRELFRYLEGNYVTTLQDENKVYIPHLQFAKESVELPYSSWQDLTLENIIADYFLKERIKSVDDLLQRFNEIDVFTADVAKEKDEPIFLRTSQYIDHSEYAKRLRKWIQDLKKMNIDFSSRESIVQNIRFDSLDLPKSIFREESRWRNEDRENYENDRAIFFEYYLGEKENVRWQRRVIREMFRDLIQCSINRHRIEIQREQRTEYEEVFRHYRDMTFHEKDVGCLLVEDGEISFVLLMDRYINNRKLFENADQLLYWGLIEKENNQYRISERAIRMAKWCMKIMGLKYSDKSNSIDYENIPQIARSYEGLIKENRIFSWMKLSDDLRKQVAVQFGKLIFSGNDTFSESEIKKCFTDICYNFYDLQTHRMNKIKTSLKNSRFQKDLNEWLRGYETINRSVIAFPVNTIPSEVENKIRTFSIFIGTFNLDDSLDADNEEDFVAARRNITNFLNRAKIFYTLIGIPASESLSEAIIRKDTQAHIESTLGRYSHKVKNEGVNLVNRMETIWSKVNKDESIPIHFKKLLMEYREGVDRLTGSIHILNIASNGLKWNHIVDEDKKYCILDILLKSYCNAFQQFFIAGIKEERKKFSTDKENEYKIPILRLHIDFSSKKKPFIIDEDIYYAPKLEKISFVTNHKHAKLTHNVPDSDDIIGKNSLNYVDLLPQRLIMASPFFELFYNAFSHMYKSKNKTNIIELDLKRSGNEINIELRNALDREWHNRPLPEFIQNSPGLMANKIFFQNIGGSLILSYKDKAYTNATINLDNMIAILNKGRVNGTK